LLDPRSVAAVATRLLIKDAAEHLYIINAERTSGGGRPNGEKIVWTRCEGDSAPVSARLGWSRFATYIGGSEEYTREKKSV